MKRSLIVAAASAALLYSLLPASAFAATSVVSDPKLDTNWSGAEVGLITGVDTGTFMPFTSGDEKISLAGASVGVKVADTFAIGRGFYIGVGAALANSFATGSRSSTFTFCGQDSWTCNETGTTTDKAHLRLKGSVTASLAYEVFDNVLVHGDSGFEFMQFSRSSTTDYHGVYDMQHYGQGQHGLGITWGGGVSWAPWGTRSVRFDVSYRQASIAIDSDFGISEGTGYHYGQDARLKSGQFSISLPI